MTQEEIKIVTTDKRKHKTTVIVAPDEVVGGFLNFLREHAVIGLAVGLVIGTQVKTVVDQIVNSFINPLYTLVFGDRLQEKHFTFHHGSDPVLFGWGSVVYTLIDFVFIMLAIYFIIKLFKLEKLDTSRVTISQNKDEQTIIKDKVSKELL